MKKLSILLLLLLLLTFISMTLAAESESSESSSSESHTTTTTTTTKPTAKPTGKPTAKPTTTTTTTTTKSPTAKPTTKSPTPKPTTLPPTPPPTPEPVVVNGTTSTTTTTTTQAPTLFMTTDATSSTSQASTTEASTTEASTTQASTTQASSTEASTTQASSTEVFTTQASTSGTSSTSGTISTTSTTTTKLYENAFYGTATVDERTFYFYVDYDCTTFHASITDTLTGWTSFGFGGDYSGNDTYNMNGYALVVEEDAPYAYDTILEGPKIPTPHNFSDDPVTRIYYSSYRVTNFSREFRGRNTTEYDDFSAGYMEMIYAFGDQNDTGILKHSPGDAGILTVLVHGDGCFHNETFTTTTPAPVGKISPEGLGSPANRQSQSIYNVLMILSIVLIHNIF